jgi:hypothetical protein
LIVHFAAPEKNLKRLPSEITVPICIFDFNSHLKAGLLFQSFMPIQQKARAVRNPPAHSRPASIKVLAAAMNGRKIVTNG